MRHLAVLALASLLALSGLARAQQPPAPVDPDAKLKKAAQRLLLDPNSPRLHLAVASQYFERGMEGDAGRVYRHVRRALQLDPTLEGDARAFLGGTTAGFRTGTRSEAQRSLDEQLEATLPVGTEADDNDPDRIVRNGLARRIASSQFRAPGPELEENRSQLAAMFGLDGSEKTVWDGRMESVGTAQQGQQGWTGDYARALQAAVERTNGIMAAEAQAEALVQEQKEESQDPMVLKNEGFVAFVKGDMPTCIDKYVKAVAAVEAVEQRAAAFIESEGVSMSLAPPRDAGGAVAGGGGPTSPPPPLPPQQTPPARQAPPPPAPNPAPAAAEPEDTSSGGTQSGTSGNPAPVPPGGAGPAGGAPGGSTGGQPGGQAAQNSTVNRRLADQCLQAVEAVGNEEVPPPEAVRKVTEAGAVGTVGEPLLLDLDRDGRPAVPGLLPDGTLGASVRFDLDGDGHVELTEWPEAARDGLLAVDLDGDGRVTSGRELFGTAFGDRDGFARLARFDLDGDGVVRGVEAASLLVWLDDGDGASEPGELRSLAERGIEALPCRPVDGAAWCTTDQGPMRCWEWLPDLRP